MDEITRLREEIQKTANELNETIRENLISAHVAATLAAAVLEPGTTPKAVVLKYRQILSELQIGGPYQGA